MPTLIEYKFGCIFCRDGIMRDLDAANQHDVDAHPEIVDYLADVQADWNLLAESLDD